MRRVTSVAALQTYLAAAQGEIGFVPTMGALHAGHLSLIHRCRQECAVTVVSIFVNPLQFGPQEDFQVYPRTLEADQALCTEAGVDLLFTPAISDVLGDPQRPRVQVVPPPEQIQTLCAPFRPGHFQGVLTIVMVLFQLIRPHRAYFGEKDAQQVRLIQQMVTDLHLPIQIVPCPTLRDADGLALSSRNRYLTPVQRQQALAIPQALRAGKSCFDHGERDAAAVLTVVKEAFTQFLQDTVGVSMQYLEIVDPDTLQSLSRIRYQGLLAMAAFVGTTRLIDHVLLVAQAPIIAIDGPAGAGKSTVARQVAQALHLTYIDTGAMYRALTWLALEEGIPMDDELGLAQLAQTARITLEPLVSVHVPVRIRINGEDVTEAIRSQRVTQSVSQVSAWAAVRQELVRQQQALGKQGGVVLEGRDIGTHVFPQAELKIFLTASVGERAKRRQLDMAERGESIDLDTLASQIEARDYQDSHRPIAPLQRAADAVVIDSDALSIEQVVNQIIRLYHQKTLE